MQERLFETASAKVDMGRDPYAEQRTTARRLADGYGVLEAEAFDMLLGYGSENAVRRVLKQRWWLGELDRIDEEAA
jgi:hypothetical protein